MRAIFKGAFSLSKKIVFIYFNENPLMKSDFYFMLKALFVLEMLTFLS